MSKRDVERRFGSPAIPGELRMVRYIGDDGKPVGGDVLQQHFTCPHGACWADVELVELNEFYRDAGMK